MRTRITALLLGVVAVAPIAAAQAPLRPVARSSVRGNSITVQNDRKVPVTVFMEYGDFDRRLGTVGALKTETLQLPAWAVRDRESIQLFVHPEGAGDLSSEEFSLQSPARLAMVVPPTGNMALPTKTMRAVIPPEELADATLTVDNPRAKPVTIYAEREDVNMDVRLGTVPAYGQVTLRLPKSVVYPDDSIKLFVHPDGGFDLASETFHVRPAVHLGLKVPKY